MLRSPRSPPEPTLSTMSRNGVARSRPSFTIRMRPACSTMNSRGSPAGAVRYSGAPSPDPTTSSRRSALRSGGGSAAAAVAAQATRAAGRATALEVVRRERAAQRVGGLLDVRRARAEAAAGGEGRGERHDRAAVAPLELDDPARHVEQAAAGRVDREGVGAPQVHGDARGGFDE